MRSKAPLSLMEQMVMLLVFALAAALCLQAFVKSDQISRRGDQRAQAAVLCQTAAEVIRSSGTQTQEALSAAAEQLGCQYDEGMLWKDYDEDWNPNGGSVYRLTAQEVSSEVSGLNQVRVAVEQEDTVLFELQLAWQGEVTPHE